MCRCCPRAGHRRSTVPRGGWTLVPSSGRAPPSWQRAPRPSRRRREVAVAGLAWRSSRESPLLSSAWSGPLSPGRLPPTSGRPLERLLGGLSHRRRQPDRIRREDGPHVPSAKASITDRARPVLVGGASSDDQAETRPLATTWLGAVGVVPSLSLLTAKPA